MKSNRNTKEIDSLVDYNSNKMDKSEKLATYRNCAANQSNLHMAQKAGKGARRLHNKPKSARERSSQHLALSEGPRVTARWARPKAWMRSLSLCQWGGKYKCATSPCMPHQRAPLRKKKEKTSAPGHTAFMTKQQSASGDGKAPCGVGVKVVLLNASWG